MTNLKIKKFNKSNIQNTLSNSGVYLFFDLKGRPIYIGKSINLKNRLKSYLLSNLLPKTQKLIEETFFFATILTNSEIEALLLEANLVKKYKPKYNTELKDDKQPLYIIITSDIYPRIITARKSDILKNVKYYYGPFPSSSSLKMTLNFLRKIFPYSQHKIGKKPCLYSQIGLCNPCPNKIEKIKNETEKKFLRQKYLQNIKAIKRILDGNLNQLLTKLEKEMHKKANQEKFEEANEIKIKLEKIYYITQKKMPLDSFLENPNLISDIRENELKTLSKALKRHLIDIKNIERIECFDVSHLQGDFPTASMVVFKKGIEDKKNYRHFKLKTEKNRDDISYLTEVALRREKYLKKWGRPDLIVVDGGIAQTKVFYQIFSKHKIAVIGIAKTYEKIIIPYLSNNKLSFLTIKNLDEPALNLIKRIRDESHRFARRLHFLLFKKYIFSFNSKKKV